VTAPSANAPVRTDAEIGAIVKRVLDLDPRIQGAKYAPQARVYNSAALTLANATATPITFNSERWDLGTSTEQHSTSANTSRLTCRTPGLYAIVGHLEYAANAVGFRSAAIQLNGAAFVGIQHITAATASIVSVSTQYRLVVGDYIELIGRQNSGGNLNVTVGANYSPELAWYWVSP
jgi:hypothetical protein